MQGSGRTVYVIGAGIAGLTLALALAKFGTTVVVLEKTRALETAGAGIQLSPNALRVLLRLGISRPLMAKCFLPGAIDIYPFRRPRPLVSLQLGKLAETRFGAPYAVIHRAALAEVLHQACRRFANIDIQFGMRSFDAEQHAKGLSMTVEDATGETRIVRPFAAVGADGVNSSTRQDILGGPAPHYSGYVAWRAMLPLDPFKELLDPNRSSLLWGPHFHAVAYPIPAANELNVALVTPVKESLLTPERLSQGPKLPRMVLPSKQFDAITAAAAGKWAAWPLNTVKTGDWHMGPVGLIGDAAHAMLPFQAQGAAMAIEDAAVLAPLLVTEPDAASAFARFQAMRQKRVAKIAALSGRNGFAYHLEWPFTIARDIVVGLQGPQAHFDRLGWIYGYDPSPEIETAPRPKP